MKNRKHFKFEEGNIILFEDFFNSNFSKFRTFASRFIPSSLSEDIVQDVFALLWELSPDKFNSEPMLQAFVYKSIYNRCLNKLKSVKTRERFSTAYLQANGNYLQEAVFEEEKNHSIYAAINRLSSQQKQVILKHLQGKSNAEIAREMKISETTVKTHKLSAYKNLRTYLKDLLPVCCLISSMIC